MQNIVIFHETAVCVRNEAQFIIYSFCPSAKCIIKTMNSVHFLHSPAKQCNQRFRTQLLIKGTFSIIVFIPSILSLNSLKGFLPFSYFFLPTSLPYFQTDSEFQGSIPFGAFFFPTAFLATLEYLMGWKTKTLSLLTTQKKGWFELLKFFPSF